MRFRWWRKKNNDVFDAAKAYSLSINKKQELEENEYNKFVNDLFEHIKSACGRGQNETFFRNGGISTLYYDEMAIRFHKYSAKIIPYLQSLNYIIEVEDDGVGLLTSSIKYKVKWGDKESIFNQQIKEIVK